MKKQTDIQTQNQKLYEKYKDFIIASFQVLKKYLEDGESVPEKIKEHISIKDNGSVGTYHRPEPMFYMFINQHEEEIKQLPQYDSLIKWRLQEDPIINKFQGRVTDSSGNIVKNPKKSAIQFFFETNAIEFLAKFIKRTKSFNFNDEIFSKCFQEYEDSLYSKEYRFNSFSPLNNFQCEADEIDLGEDLKLRKYSNREIEDWWHRLSESKILHHFPIPIYEIRNLKYFIEMSYIIKKGEPISDQLPMETFNKVISALRIFKSGIVGFDMLYSTELMWSDMGIIAGGGLYRKSFFGTQYKLMTLDIEGFKKFWNEFKDIEGKHDFLERAIRRFNYAYERERSDDKLIDYMIAFEALFSEAPGDIGHKLSSRAAKLLEKDFDQRKEIYDIMKEGYNHRSTFAHGKHAKPVQFKSYLFSWDEVPGNDSGRLIEFLKQNYGIDWAKTAKIDKIDNDKTIRVSTEKNCLSLKLNPEKTKVNLIINNSKANEFIVEMKNGKLNLYKSQKIPLTEFVPMIEELLRRSIKEVIIEVMDPKVKTQKDLLDRIDFVR